MPQQESLLDFLKNYWFIFLFTGSLIVTWSQFQSRISNLESEVTALQGSNQTISSHLASIDVSLAQINTSLLYIKNNASK